MESSQSSYAIWRLWLSMLAQQNVAIVRNGQFSYGPAGAATLARISDWFRSGYAQAGLDYPASTSQFMGGNAAFMLNGVWEVPELVRAIESRHARLRVRHRAAADDVRERQRLGRFARLRDARERRPSGRRRPR